MGLVAIEGMQFYAYHGHFKEENVVGNQFMVDVYVNTDLTKASETDELEDTVDYERIYRIAKDEMETRSKLLEHVGKRIIDRIAAELHIPNGIKLRISKLHPPVRGNVKRVFVELEV